MRLSTSPPLDPFYLFGYGSLLWRPGDLLGAFPSFPCTAYGYQRLFVQRSSDHRGLPEFPGLVATLVHDNDLKSNSLSHLNLVQSILSTSSSSSSSSSFSSSSESIRIERSNNQSECVGLVWLIPSESRESLLEELDFREKGGYSRHAIKVRLHQRTPVHEMNEVADAIVYTGSISNPMFDFRPLQLGSSYYNLIHLSTASATTSKVNPEGRVESISKSELGTTETTQVTRKRFPFLLPRNLGANIISVSKGPSGTNIEYLFGLLRFVNRSGQRDEYLTSLCRDVLLRSGTWQARHIVRRYWSEERLDEQQNIDRQASSTINNGSSDDSSKLMPFDVIGWGSNEFQQLQHTLPTIVSQPALLSNHQQHLQNNTALSDGMLTIDLLNNSTMISFKQNCTRCVLTNSQNERGDQNPTMKYQRTNDGNKTSNKNEYLHIWEMKRQSSVDVYACMPVSDVVLAGGRLSGYLRGDSLTLWGADIHELVDLPSFNLSEADTESKDIVQLVLRGVRACALGPDHMILVTVAGQIIGLGDNSCGQCIYPMQSSTSQIGTRINIAIMEATVSEKDAVVKVAVGLRHSAAITSEGRLHTWGQSRHGQSLYPQNGSSSSCAGWRPPNNAHVTDVACGSRHTVCVDDDGRIWTFGDNRFGALGRFVETKSSNDSHSQPGVVVLKKISPSDLNIKWQKVSSGWHHSVARGVRNDGSVITCGWGRRDLSQYPCRDPTTANNINADSKDKTSSSHSWEPMLLSPLPVEGAEITELWCGSEFTIAADDAGLLWACGWNEHRNLGHNDVFNVISNASTDNNGVLAITDANSTTQWRPIQYCDVSQLNGMEVNKPSQNHQQTRIAVLSDGSIACGGSHCLALTHIV